MSNEGVILCCKTFYLRGINTFANKRLEYLNTFYFIGASIYYGNFCGSLNLRG